MAKVVVAKLNAGPSSVGASAVAEKRVRGADGRVRTLRVIDANSDTFGADLLYVFGKNVAKARRDNKRIVGANDVAIPKR